MVRRCQLSAYFCCSAAPLFSRPHAQLTTPMVHLLMPRRRRLCTSPVSPAASLLASPLHSTPLLSHLPWRTGTARDVSESSGLTKTSHLTVFRRNGKNAQKKLTPGSASKLLAPCQKGTALPCPRRPMLTPPSFPPLSLVCLLSAGGCLPRARRPRDHAQGRESRDVGKQGWWPRWRRRLRRRRVWP